MAAIPNKPDLSRSGWDHFTPVVFSTNTDLRKYDQVTHPTLHELSTKVGSYYWDYDYSPSKSKDPVNHPQNENDSYLVLPAYNADCAGVLAARFIMVLTDKGPTALRALGLGAAFLARVVVTAILGAIQYGFVVVGSCVVFPLWVTYEGLYKLAELSYAGGREVYRYFTSYYIKEEMRESFKVRDERIQKLEWSNAALQGRLSALMGDGNSALRLDGVLDEEDFEQVEEAVEVDKDGDSESPKARVAPALLGPGLNLTPPSVPHARAEPARSPKAPFRGFKVQGDGYGTLPRSSENNNGGGLGLPPL